MQSPVTGGADGSEAGLQELWVYGVPCCHSIPLPYPQVVTPSCCAWLIGLQETPGFHCKF